MVLPDNYPSDVWLKIDKMVFALGCVGIIMSWEERKLKFFEGKYVRRILIETIFIDPMILETESVEEVRDRLKIIEEDEKRENATKIVGTDKGKYPVAVPGTTKGFVEDMGFPKLQSRFVRPESGVMRVENDFRTRDEGVEYDDVSGENWYSTWEEVLQVINSEEKRNSNPEIRGLGENIGANLYRSIQDRVETFMEHIAVSVKETIWKLNAQEKECSSSTQIRTGSGM